jgi:hypothetical protein
MFSSLSHHGSVCERLGNLKKELSKLATVSGSSSWALLTGAPTVTDKETGL